METTQPVKHLPSEKMAWTDIIADYSNYCKPLLALYEVIIPEVIYKKGKSRVREKNYRQVCIADSCNEAYLQTIISISANVIYKLSPIQNCTINVLGNI